MMSSVSCILRKATSGEKFIALEHGHGRRFDAMIDKVHELHWDIAYSYGDDCHPEDKVNDKALTAAVTEALHIWLQPLRDYAKRSSTSDRATVSHVNV